MELFPAADDEQFEFIKRIIHDSDYYIVISAGRYGSLHPDTGLSYTEMEFDYAKSQMISVIALVHSDLDSITAGYTEPTDQGKLALEKFRQKLKAGRIVRPWTNPIELGTAVMSGLNWVKKHKPAIGWVRADRIATEESMIQIAELKQRIAELELQLERQKQATLDIDRVLDQYVGETKVATRVTNQKEKSREIIIKFRDLAQSIMFICLHERVEDEIKKRIQRVFSINECGDAFTLTKLSDKDLDCVLNLLEADSILSSTTESYQQLGVMTTGSSWSTRRVFELAPQARRWAAREASKSLLAPPEARQ
jgi:hypothetical protein